MSPITITRTIGSFLLLGILCFVIYSYLKANALKRDLTDLHLHDSYYVVLSPLGLILIIAIAIVAISCLIAPAKIIAIFH